MVKHGGLTNLQKSIQRLTQRIQSPPPHLAHASERMTQNDLDRTHRSGKCVTDGQEPCQTRETLDSKQHAGSTSTGGPRKVERRYTAPFALASWEEDYRIAWEHFERMKVEG